ENEDTTWAPLHVERGFDRDADVVTAFPSTDCPVQFRGPSYEFSAAQLAEMLSMKLARTRYFFSIGAYALVVSPAMQHAFYKEGWSKADLRRSIMETCCATAADLKRMGHWWYDG